MIVLGTVGALGACASSSGSSSNREQARSYARGSIPCAVDSDCCVVIDRCINQALVVRASVKDTVASLVSQPDPGGCTGCILPSVQVSCTQGQCAGVLVDSFLPDGGVDAATYASLTRDHCGPVPGVPSSTQSVVTEVKVQEILGCGPQ
jgi:hypothetical protein